MSNVLNFTGVEEGLGNTYLEPGVHEVKIAKTEEGASTQKGTAYLRVYFENDRGAGHHEDFYLTKGALPRIQHLVSQFVGKPLAGDVTIASLNAMLVGKKARILLDGEKTFNKEGKVVTYGRLRFAGFAQPLDAPNGAFLVQEVKIEDKTLNASNVAVEEYTNDLPF